MQIRVVGKGIGTRGLLMEEVKIIEETLSEHDDDDDDEEEDEDDDDI
jgi:hypothetical protein